MNSNDYKTYCIQPNYEGSNQTITIKSECACMSMKKKEKVSESAGKTSRNEEGKEFH